MAKLIGARTCGKTKILCFKEIDKEYRTTFINFAKYHLIMFAIARIMKMTKEEQNQVELYLFNAINFVN